MSLLLFLFIFLLLEVNRCLGLLDHHGIYKHCQLKESNIMRTLPKCRHPAPVILRTSSLFAYPRYFFCLRALQSTAEDFLSSQALAIQEELVALRKRLSIELKKPAFVVFTNKARDAIILEKPQSAEEIASLSYSGNKISKYAYSEILRITSKFLECDPQPDDRITQTSTGSRVESVSSTAESCSDEEDESDDSKDPDMLLSSLSVEQQRAAQRALSGQNLFITGSAGTGKSFLLKYIVQEAKKQHSGQPDSVVVTAPTGVAAINVGGATINSFAGYGLGK
jgi:predicted NACHT family NTPase